MGVAKEFSPLSWLLGRLSPRLCDSLAFVRLQSLHGIWLAFKLSLLHRGHSPLDTDLVDSSLFDVNGFVETHFGGALEGRLDTNKCSAAILAIAKVNFDEIDNINRQILRRLRKDYRKAKCKPICWCSSKCFQVPKIIAV